MTELIADAIERASTLPSRFYTDPELFERSKDAIFAKSWQFVGDTDLVRVPTAVHPFTLLDGCLDEPLLLTRDTDDQIHLMSNVCTHRGFLVMEHGGCVRQLRCRYHGRRFGLDGSFRSMPEFNRAEDFPSAADSLPKAPLERWGRFLFASVDPQPGHGIAELLEDVERRLGWLPTEEFVFDPQRSRDYRVQA
ncbi:MAG: Rieske (2Fe-2S) protein, partial [Acidobacteriota bacterium]